MAKNQKTKTAPVVESPAPVETAPVQSSMDADPARSGGSINDRAAVVAAVEVQVAALREVESDMLARFDAFTSDAANDDLCLWIYHYTLRNVFVSPDKGIKSIADMLRARYSIDAADKRALKSKRNAWDYLRGKGQVLAGAEPKTGGKAATPHATKFAEYVKANFIIADGKLSLSEAFAALSMMEERYKAAYSAAQDKAA